MTDAFLTIDDQPITPQQVINYLQIGRKLEGFIGEIVRQFVIEREINQMPDLQVNTAAIEQSVIDFRLQQQLTDPQRFQQFLAANALTYESFHNQVAMGFKVQKLKETLTESQLNEFFVQRKPFLDRVIISRIIVQDKELADELRSQLAEGAKFEQLAREYSLTDDKVMNGMVGPVSIGTMPEMLRSATEAARPGDVVGPLTMEERWGLFRVEEFLPASLENPQIVQMLQEELFEQWLAEKMQKLPIKLQA